MPPPDENTAVDPLVVPLVVRSRTSDGVDVVALADLTVQVRDVESLVDDLEALETRWPGVLTTPRRSSPPPLRSSVEQRRGDPG
jgi:hypothetical protein